MTTKRRIRIRILGELLILILLIVLFFSRLNQYLNHPVVKSAIFQAINKSFYGELGADEVKVALTEWTVEGWHAFAEDKHNRQIASAPYVKITFKPSAFFHRRVKLEKIELDRPAVHLWTDPDHVFIWKKFKKPPKKLNPVFRTRAGTVFIKEGSFTYDYYPEPNPIHIFLDGVNARAIYSDKIPYIQGAIEKLYLYYSSFDGWFEQVKVDGKIYEDSAEVFNLEAFYLNISLVASGTISGFKKKNPDLHLKIKAQGKIGDLLKHFKYYENPPGDFTLTAQVTGPSDDYFVNGDFTSSYGVIEGQRYDNFSATFVYHKQIVTLQKFSLQMYGMTFTGRGWYNISNGDFHAEGSAVHKGRAMSFRVDGNLDTDKDLMSFRSIIVRTPSAMLNANGFWMVSSGALHFRYRLGMFDIRRELSHWGTSDFGGKLFVSGRLDGRITNPMVTAEGEISELFWTRVPLGSGAVSAKLSDGDIEANFDLAVDGGSARAFLVVPFLRGGNIVSVREHPLHFEASLSNYKITPQIMGTDFSGIAEGHLEGGGTTTNLRAQGIMKMRRISAWGQSVETAEAQVVLTDEGVEFDEMKISLISGDKGRGYLWLDWDLNYEVELIADSLHLSSIDKVKNSELPVSGAGSLHAYGRGNFDHVRISADVELNSLSYDKLDLIGGKLTINLDNDDAFVMGNLYHGVTMDGCYNLENGVFKNFVVIMDKMPLQPIFVWKEIENADGFITGSLTLNGGEGGWDDVDYRMLLSELSLTVGDKEIKNISPVKIEYGPSGGTEDIHLVSDRGRLSITGKVSGAKIWDIDVNGSVDLALLEAFFKEVRKSSGTLLLNAHIEGTSDNLETAGFLEIQEGAFRFRGYQGNFQEISGKVIFTPGEFEFDKFHGKIDDAGDFSIKGKVFYQGGTISEFDVWVDASELTFSKPEYYKVVIAPSLHFSGTPSSPVISGRVQITDGRYIKDVRVERQFVEVQRETAPTRPPPEWLKNLKMNIIILDDGNFRVRNNFADMRIRTDLKLTGSPLSFSIDGYMEGVDGKIFYGGTAFDVVTARLDFSDPLKIDPYVNVFAQTEIRTYQIRLYLKGRLSRMVLTLESSPTLDDQNILSLITFHKLADELTQSEINVLATLPMFFSQLSGNPLATPLEKYTGLNILMIEAQENNPGMRVTVGSDLTKRLRILYSAETSGVAPLHETQAIFKITDNIWLQGTQNNQGIYSFKLNFHFEME